MNTYLDKKNILKQRKDVKMHKTKINIIINQM